jgi:hypothetical protein
VRTAIQSIGTELWSTQVADYSPKTPTGPNVTRSLAATASTFRIQSRFDAENTHDGGVVEGVVEHGDCGGVVGQEASPTR